MPYYTQTTNQTTALCSGWAAYFNTDLTPISIPAGTPTKLTLTTTAQSVDEEFLPLGTSSLWDSVNSQFDFSSLQVGDSVDIRVDGELTNTGFNESYKLNLHAALGAPSEYVLPFASGTRIFAGTAAVSRYNSLYIRQHMIDYPSELRLVTTDASTGFLIDIFIRVIRK